MPRTEDGLEINRSKLGRRLIVLALMLARAVAMGAEILAGSRRAGCRLVARMDAFAAHVGPTRRKRQGSDDSAGGGAGALLAST